MNNMAPIKNTFHQDSPEKDLTARAKMAKGVFVFFIVSYCNLFPLPCVFSFAASGRPLSFKDVSPRSTRR